MIGAQESEEFHQGHLASKISDPNCRICLASRTQSATISQRKALHVAGVVAGAAFAPGLTAVQAAGWMREIRSRTPRLDLYEVPPATREI